MSEQRTVVTVGTSYAALNLPDVNPGFEANFMVIAMEDAGDPGSVAISFDGVNDHIILSAGIVPSVTLPLRLSKVWMKAAAGTNRPSVGVFQSNSATAH